MATDGPTPTPCNKEIYENGKVVFVTHGIPSNAMEGWIRIVASWSGQPVDWHFCGGRAFVKTTGEIDKVIQSIQELIDIHDRLYERECDSFTTMPTYHIDSIKKHKVGTIYGIDGKPIERNEPVALEKKP